MSHMPLRSSTSTPAVGSSRNSTCGWCDERLGDQHPAHHAARELADLRVALVPERELAQQLLELGLVARLAEQRRGCSGPSAATRAKMSSFTSCGTSPTQAARLRGSR